MSIIRPATPGFIVTLIATILLGVVSFCVPLIKSVYFLKASLEVENVNGFITFGTLGYCLDIAGANNCSTASVGYELNINELVGNKLSVQIPNVVVKWLTYALVLHIVAFGLAGISAILGLLAHVREMSMSCFSSCFAGFAASIALIAFIFDIALFFIAKSRLNSVTGGSAQIGNAVWLTLAAWLLLFFSGCFYAIGRCCVTRRPRNGWRDKEQANPYADQMHLDAVKAEADRKARQQGEAGLPAFHEWEPLKASIVGDEVHVDDEVPYRDHQDHSVSSSQSSYGRKPSGYVAGGYTPAPRGTRAVDDYNNVGGQTGTTAYPPPQSQRRTSALTQTTTSGYTPSSNSSYPAAGGAAVPAAAGHQQYHDTSATGYFNQDPYAHPAGASPYNDALNQYAGQAYAYQPQQNPETSYNATAAAYNAPPRNDYSPGAYGHAEPVHQPDRSYTLGGGGYGASTVPDFHTPSPAHDQYHPSAYGVPPVQTDVAALATSRVGGTSPVKGPREPRVTSPQEYEDEYPTDNPPGYLAGPSRPPGEWGIKS